MQPTPVLYRSFYPTRLYFKEYAPLRLKNQVSSRYDQKITGKGCLGEMQSLLACMKNHEFENSPCVKEFEAFQKCTGLAVEEVDSVKSAFKKGILSEENDRQLGYKQLNILLKCWKQPSAGSIHRGKHQPPHIPYSDWRSFPCIKRK